MTEVAGSLVSTDHKVRDQAAFWPAEDLAVQRCVAVRRHWTRPSAPGKTHLVVLHFLEDTIQYGRPTVCSAAQAASMNLRTMQRHLAACGVTFKGLLNEYRQFTAIEFLQNGDKSITDIAFTLGYSDSAHFTRAFRRWTGMNPRKFQRTLPQDRYQADLNSKSICRGGNQQ